MSLVARRYNVNANLVFSWWRQYPEEVHDAGTGRFVVVLVQATVEGEADTVTPCPVPEDGVVAAAGRMEIAPSNARMNKWDIACELGGPLHPNRSANANSGLCTLGKRYINASPIKSNYIEGVPVTIIADFEQTLRRRSPASYGQWYAVDLHNHSPASYDYRGNKSSALDDAVEHLSTAPVDIVMFTDHQTLPSRSFTEELAKRSQKTILRGIEFNIFADAWTKPQGKVEKNAFFHLLAGFDPDASQDADYWFAHIKKECSHSKRNIGGNDIYGLNAPVDKLCTLLQEAGAITIPAHLHTESDAFKSRSIDDIYGDEEFLGLAKNHFTALEIIKPSTAAFFDGDHSETNYLQKTCIRSSDAHDVTNIGRRITYVQLERPIFSELRGSLSMPFRVSLQSPTVTESEIIGINVTGQFFADLWLSFSSYCNAFIGVKGSGKTSVLECLRFALGVAVPDTRRDDVQAHLANILGPASTVRVLIRRKDGAKILVQRTASRPDQFILTFEDGRQEQVQNPAALMFPSYILGWHEIEQAATDPNIRQLYLDTIAGREQIRQLQETVESSANEVKYLHEQVMGRHSTFLSLHDQVRRLKDLRAGLQRLTDANLVVLRDSYEEAIRHRDATSELILRLRDTLTHFSGRAHGLLTDIDISSFDGESPLQEFAEFSSNTLESLKRDIDQFVEGHKARIESAITSLEEKSEEMERSFQQFTETYTEAVAELSPEQQRMLESHRQVMEDTRAFSRLEGQCDSERQSLEGLLTELIRASNAVADALDDQTRLRTQKVQELNRRLQTYGISLEVAPLARRSLFDDLSQRYSTGATIFSELSSLAPSESRHHRRLAQGYESMKRDLLEGFTLFISSSEFMGYLTAYEQDDLQIGFDVGKSGEKYSPIDQLSAGQRCTAIFPLLLELQEGPLVVDQPEDNMDNRHIADSIAPALLQDKKSRQIVFTSHNANLVVLTDAEHVVMFEGSGSQGTVHARGFLCTSQSRICSEVISILDGGEKALRQRHQKYGTLDR